MHQQDRESRENFLATLDWLMAVIGRYQSSLHFALVHNTFGDRNELGEAYGAREAVRQLATLTESLKGGLRKTDLICRNGKDIWVLVPFNSATERLCDKVQDIFQSIEHEGLHVFNRRTAVFDLSAMGAEVVAQFKALDAYGLFDYLLRNKESLATCQCTSMSPCTRRAAAAGEQRPGTAA